MKPYRATSLKSAERLVRSLRRQVAERDALLNLWSEERIMLAKLGDDTAQFSNPLEIVEAKKIRDAILLHELTNELGI
jgi:hypothetical protein